MNTKAKAPRLTTLEKLEKIAPGVAAQALALALPYNTLAASLATALAGAKVATERAKGEKVTVWDSFKAAIVVATEQGHAPDVMRSGLEIACEEAGIPSGSFRGYVSTIVSLYGDCVDGNLEWSDVEAISVADARKRYVSEEKAVLLALKERLSAATSKLSLDDLITVVEAAEDMAGIARVTDVVTGEEAGEEAEYATTLEEAQAA